MWPQKPIVYMERFGFCRSSHYRSCPIVSMWGAGLTPSTGFLFIFCMVILVSLILCLSGVVSLPAPLTVLCTCVCDIVVLPSRHPGPRQVLRVLCMSYRARPSRLAASLSVIWCIALCNSVLLPVFSGLFCFLDPFLPFVHHCASKACRCGVQVHRPNPCFFSFFDAWTLTSELVFFDFCFLMLMCCIFYHVVFFFVVFFFFFFSFSMFSCVLPNRLCYKDCEEGHNI